MKIDDLKQSKHVEDRRGQSSSGSSAGIGLLLQLLISSGKGKWIAIAVIVFLLFAGGGSLGDLVNLGTSTLQDSYETSSNTVTVSDEDAIFLSKVFASTETYWTETFEAEGLTYDPPTLVIYDGQTQTSGCGVGSANAGPFYCPVDEKVYIDLSFYDELTTKYDAEGDFAMAYVIAHEVGHHVQNELGTMDDYNKERQELSETEANALNVRLELRATSRLLCRCLGQLCRRRRFAGDGRYRGSNECCSCSWGRYPPRSCLWYYCPRQLYPRNFCPTPKMV